MQRTIAVVLLLGLLGIPLGIGLTFACDPLSARHAGPEWLPVAALQDLKCDGLPQRLTLFSAQHHAWTRGESQPVATVFVRCDGAGQGLTVWPSMGHLGCWIEFDSAHRRFRLPCYNLEFDIDGKLLDRGVLDFEDLTPLAHRIERGQLWVRAADTRRISR